MTSPEAKTASALVVPQTVSAGSQFIKIALGENIRYYTLPADKVLKSGYAHNYKLIVKEQKVEVKSESVIGDWNGDDNTGDAEEVKSGRGTTGTALQKLQNMNCNKLYFDKVSLPSEE